MKAGKWVLTGLVAVGLAAAATMSHAATDETKIIKGEDATEPYPFMVSTQKGSRPHCGGALIDRSWVVTAAHCNDTTQVRIGSPSTTSGGEVIAVKRTVRAPLSEQVTGQEALGQDIALIELAQPSTQTPVPIGQAPTYGAPVRTLGWGVRCQDARPSCNDVGNGPLQQLDTQIEPPENCGEFGVIDPGFQWCVGPAANGGQACQGDSGGPLLTRVGGSFQLVGVTSGPGTDSRTCQIQPGVWENVTAHMDWIRETIGGSPEADAQPTPGESADESTGQDPGQEVEQEPGQEVEQEPGQEAGPEPGQEVEQEPGQDAEQPGQDVSEQPEQGDTVGDGGQEEGGLEEEED